MIKIIVSCSKLVVFFILTMDDENKINKNMSSIEMSHGNNHNYTNENFIDNMEQWETDNSSSLPTTCSSVTKKCTSRGLKEKGEREKLCV